jgi:putative transposase
MKPASARRTSSPADGRNVGPAPGRRAISAPNGFTSSAQFVPRSAHAVVIVDQAGWHMSPKLNIPDNITLLPLPPRSPELNPVENVWQFMRDNWLSNRIFESYDDIVALCCEAWNNLVDQPWRIMSIGMRDWAHEF